MPIRVLLADDHPIVRSGIRNELARQAGMEVVGEALNGDDALDLARALNPDILLLDIQMPGKKAIDVVHALADEESECAVLVLSAHGDVPTIIGMLKAGAKGYILKDEDPTILTEAIQAVQAGSTWLSPGVSDRLASIIGSLDGVVANPVFTGRELQVLEALARGGTTREICASLQMAERTVEFHITNILKKLGAKGRLEAVMRAKELGVL